MRPSTLLAAMATIIATTTAAAAASAGSRRVPSAFHQLPPATALLGSRSYGQQQQQQQQQQRQRQHQGSWGLQRQQRVGIGAAAPIADRLPSIRRGFFRFSSSSTSSRLLASNFGYPEAAEEAVGKSQSYLQAFLDAPDAGRPVVPVELVSKEKFEAWLQGQDPRTQQLLAFKQGEEGAAKHKAGGWELIPSWDAGGSAGVAKVAFFVGKGGLKPKDPFVLSSLPSALPASADYQLVDFEGGAKLKEEATLAAFSWAMGTYKMERYKQQKKDKDGKEDGSSSKKPRARLLWPEGADKNEVDTKVGATFLVRDMVNMPTECMGPAQIQRVAELLAARFGGQASAIVGGDLLKENFPQIHTVGRAAAKGREPRLIDLTWGEASHPKVTLVGKGVAYDTGGLDIKPGPSMAGMKKDMAGAAQVLGLAYMIMSAKLPVRLRVLVPAVENAIDGGAYRNGDIIKARNGKTSEIITTDAEGRLVLADALVLADEEDPDLIIDCATLTGAARVAMGTEMQAIWSNKEGLGRRLQELSWGIADPVWQMPLYQGYRKCLKSNLADMRNTGAGGSGSITAALYLEEFLQKRSQPGASRHKHKVTPWIHMDHNGANPSGRPGRPDGGDAQGMRALFELIKVEVAAQGGWPQDEPAVEAVGDGDDE